MPSRWQKVAPSDALGVEPGRERRRLPRVEPLHVDAEAALQRDVARETSRRSTAVDSRNR